MTQPPGYPPQPGDPYGPQDQPPAAGWPAGYPQQQPPAEPYPPSSGAPYQPAYPTSAIPSSGYPTAGYPVAGYPTAGHPAAEPYPPTGPAAAPPPRRRGLIITSIVLAIALVLCGGGAAGAYYLVKKVEGNGQPNPVEAVDGFLKAVFLDNDAEKAARYVCPDARDTEALSKKIDELETFRDQYKSPQYSWPTPTVQEQDGKTATVTATVKLTTSDDRVSEKNLKIITVDESGWWVCEVTEG